MADLVRGARFRLWPGTCSAEVWGLGLPSLGLGFGLLAWEEGSSWGVERGIS